MVEKLDPDYIWECVETHQMTLPALSEHLSLSYPGEKGFSVRNLKRFCADHDIHRIRPFTPAERDEVVKQGVEEVSV